MLEKRIDEISVNKFAFQMLARHKRQSRRYFREVVDPLIDANSAALREFSQAMQQLAVDIGGKITGIVATPPMRWVLDSEGNLKLKKVVQAWERAREAVYVDGTYVNPEAILLDQVLEAYLKACVGAGKHSKFPEVTAKAVEMKVIATTQKASLDRFHNEIRNPAQHEDRLVSLEDLCKFLTFMSMLLTDLCEGAQKQ
jgi:hypothetical protein